MAEIRIEPAEVVDELTVMGHGGLVEHARWRLAARKLAARVDELEAREAGESDG